MAKPSRRTVRRASQPERTVIRSSGEIFADGSVIELVSLANDDQLGVLFWHNNRKTIAAQVDLLENSRALNITVARGPASWVFDSSRGTFYAISVRLVAEQPCTLLCCRMRTDWDDHIVLRSFDEEKRVWRLGPLSFAREEVLNQRIENALCFDHRGDWCEGMILANGLRPIPEKYLDGASVPFQLIFEDVSGEEIHEAANLLVTRTHGEILPEQRGTGLYGPRRSVESRRVAAPGNLHRAKPRPTVPEYGDDALGSLKYREGCDRIQSET